MAKLNIKLALSQLKIEANWRNLIDGIKKAGTPTSLIRNFCLGEITPQYYGQIKLQPTLYLGTENDEARWLFATLYFYRDKLRDTLVREAIIKTHLFEGKYKAAIAEIDHLESESGVSLTTLYYRFFAIERSQGIAEHKRYLSELNEKSASNILFIVAADFISRRAEKDASAEALELEFQKLKEQIPKLDTLYNFFRLITLQSYREFRGDIARLLLYSSTLPLIDRYYALRTLAPHIEEGIGDAATFTRCKNATSIIELEEFLELCLHGSETPKDIPQVPIESDQQPILPQTPSTLSILERTYLTKPFHVTGLSTTGLEGTVLADTISLIDKVNDGRLTEKEAQPEAKKLAQKLPSREIAFLLAARFETGPRDDTQSATLLRAYLSLPKRIEAASKNDFEAAIVALSLPPAAPQPTTSTPNDSYGNKCEALRKLINQSLSENDLATAAKHGAQLLTANGILKSATLEDLANKILLNKDFALHRQPDAAIVLSYSGVEPKRLYPPFEAHLHSLELKTIEELINSQPKPLAATLHFLERVAILPVIARSPAYRSTAEAEATRMKVCQFLISNEHAIGKISAEIAELTQRQLIRHGVSTVRRSKIYVDESGIRRNSELLFREKFQQFSTTISNPGADKLKLLDVKNVALFLPNEAGELIRTTPGKQINTEGEIRLLTHSQFLLFKSLFLDIRDQFVGSNSHGLDSYLSIRIRHGTLQGQLRSPFEEQRLILQRASGGGDYLQSNYWSKSLRLQPNDPRQEILHSTLSVLSTEVDAAISEVKDRIVHTWTESKRRDGYFDFSYSDAELLQLLEKEFLSVTNHEVFLDRAFRVLWQRTIEILDLVRAVINGDVALRLRLALEIAERDLRQTFHSEEAHELFQAIPRAYTGISNAIQTVEDWFQPSSQSTPEALELGVITNIAVVSYANTHPIRKFKVKPLSQTKKPLSGKICTPLYDILAALLDNAFTHSRLNADESNVSVEMEASDNEFEIRVSNNYTGLQASWAAEAINAAIATHLHDPNQDSIRSEGGTGIKKIIKILRFDLARENWEFSATSSNNTVAVSLKFELQGLTA